MIQGGGLTADMKNKQGHAPIKNEATNGLKNKRGTLSMARTNDINSATSQFFINVVDNDFLDHKPGNYGYAVFGRIDSGMDVVDAIAAVKTGSKGGYQDVPIETVTIESVRRVDEQVVLSGGGLSRHAGADHRSRFWRAIARGWHARSLDRRSAIGAVARAALDRSADVRVHDPRRAAASARQVSATCCAIAGSTGRRSRRT